jgi:hypothetical protein
MHEDSKAVAGVDLYWGVGSGFFSGAHLDITFFIRGECRVLGVKRKHAEK